MAIIGGIAYYKIRQKRGQHHQEVDSVKNGIGGKNVVHIEGYREGSMVELKMNTNHII